MAGCQDCWQPAADATDHSQLLLKSAMLLIVHSFSLNYIIIYIMTVHMYICLTIASAAVHCAAWHNLSWLHVVLYEMAGHWCRLRRPVHAWQISDLTYQEWLWTSIQLRQVTESVECWVQAQRHVHITSWSQCLCTDRSCCLADSVSLMCVML